MNILFENCADPCLLPLQRRASELNCVVSGRLPLISMALVEGRALGGGAELTTACDFRCIFNCLQGSYYSKRIKVFSKKKR